MVCPRCIQSVEEILDRLQIETVEVQLGQVLLMRKLNSNELSQLKKELEQVGFELLDDHASKLINQIKSIIIDEIHYVEEPSPKNLSSLLSDRLHYDYSYLSRLFSSVEGRTIENYVIAQKIEKVKEFLFYNEMTLEEIAFQMHYSSAAHLSTQFKKATGMSPSQFKKQNLKNRKSLDAL
ncbi:MAG: helix-turn-helix transcriptional regulator [Saprospiraceae bacterium]|nr:helix-turn-helix transcriptional regulator [Saprospiraceae bacterium]